MNTRFSMSAIGDKVKVLEYLDDGSLVFEILGLPDEDLIDWDDIYCWGIYTYYYTLN